MILTYKGSFPGRTDEARSVSNCAQYLEASWSSEGLTNSKQDYPKACVKTKHNRKHANILEPAICIFNELVFKARSLELFTNFRTVMSKLVGRGMTHIFRKWSFPSESRKITATVRDAWETRSFSKRHLDWMTKANAETENVNLIEEKSPQSRNWILTNDQYRTLRQKL